MVGEEGLEPSQSCDRWNLNPVRLPIPPLARHLFCFDAPIMPLSAACVNQQSLDLFPAPACFYVPIFKIIEAV
jgi:hypothetical protein